jgi:ATP-binding cassette subfamily B protein
MGFILDGLDSESYDRTYSDRDLLKRILAYFKPHQAKMIGVVLLILLDSLFGTATPIILSGVIDAVQKQPGSQWIVLSVLGLLSMGLLSWVAGYVRRMNSSKIIGNVVLKVREDVFAATIRHDLSFYDEQSSGKIVSRVTSDTQDFSAVVTLVLDLMSQILLVVILVGWLMRINVWLTLLQIAVTPLAFVVALSFRRIAREVTRKARRVNAIINAQIQESISGIVVAKAFRQEHAIYDNFKDNNKKSYLVGLRRDMTYNALFLYASGLATRSSISPGNWYLFMQAAGYIWFPMTSIASFWSQFQDGLSAAERVFALIDAEPKVKQVDNQVIDPMQGRITFENVRFSYRADEVVLDDFSLDIPANQTIAIVGHTGAGKSSIARLIPRFYEFQAGRLLVDGVDVRTLDLDHYRRHIGLVPQEPFLFSGTVSDNIRYSKPGATDDEVETAATQISHGDWIQDLSDGLATEVGERGANLSMGQRQLVALARVLLKDPIIFILDEATATVDPFTETQIQEGLEALMQNRTAIVIAHRLTTIKNADRIIVLDHGAIQEEGTHTELLKHEGLYAELYNTYFRHQSLEYIEQFGQR